MVTSYSWRRVPPTMADTFQSTTEQINHFGAWAGVHGKAEARAVHRTMAYRHNGRKAEQEMNSKLEHWYIFRELCQAAAPMPEIQVGSFLELTWEHIAAATQQPGGRASSVLELVRQRVGQYAADALLAVRAKPAWGATKAKRPLRFSLKGCLPPRKAGGRHRAAARGPRGATWYCTPGAPRVPMGRADPWEGDPSHPGSRPAAAAAMQAEGERPAEVPRDCLRAPRRT